MFFEARYKVFEVRQQGAKKSIAFVFFAGLLRTNLGPIQMTPRKMDLYQYVLAGGSQWQKCRREFLLQISSSQGGGLHIGFVGDCLNYDSVFMIRTHGKFLIRDRSKRTCGLWTRFNNLPVKYALHAINIFNGIYCDMVAY